MDDLVFDWEKETPLVVDSHIELPQHNLVDAKIGDCHNVYSSGIKNFFFVLFLKK